MGAFGALLNRELVDLPLPAQTRDAINALLQSGEVSNAAADLAKTSELPALRRASILV